MKLAFCFLTRSNLHQPAVWDRFFSDADPAQYNIYSHVKFPMAVTDRIVAESKIKEYVPTKFGHVSIVVATAKLFEAAAKDDAENTFFILLSESAVPIKPFKKIVEELAQVGQRSIIAHSVPVPGHEHRFRLNMVVEPKIFADNWFRQEQWMVLHRSHVEALLRTPRYSMFEHVFAADEHYFINTLVNICGVPVSEIEDKFTTFVNWRERMFNHHVDRHAGALQRSHPKTYESLTPQDIDEAEKSGCWFFRKVSLGCDCGLILERIAAPAN